MKGNCETVAVKREATLIKERLEEVAHSISKDSEKYGRVYEYLVDFFEPHSLNYITKDGYLAPAFFVQGTSLKKDALEEGLKSHGVHIFGSDYQKLGVTEVYQFYVALAE